jgi:type I restriction-modification system DNA methylase subunit
MTKEEMQNNSEVSQKSLMNLADQLVAETKEMLRESQTEEDLRVRFERFLDPIKKELGIQLIPKYEKSVYCGRSDAMHGQLIIEYERPAAFSSKNNIEHAYQQLVNYITAESKGTNLNQFVGIGFDGERIFFVKNYQNQLIKEPKDGAYDFNLETAKTFLIHLRALSRLPLTAENLAQKFGPKSEVGQKAVRAFANALEYWGPLGEKNRPREVFFYEWKRLFGIIYGEHFNSGNKEKESQTLLRVYKLGKEIDFQELLFSIHTYFAFLMKLIAAELLNLRETTFTSSLTSRLTHIPDDELKSQLEDIENGGMYSRKGITNFLEGDFFRWYLDTFESPELKDAIREIVRTLSEFEPATSTLDPSPTRDLLKKLYQYLVPKEVRHGLGEYYTPDWLAELLLNEVGYDGDNAKRFLDPACGSGTFLVLAIQKAIKWGRENGRPDLEIAKSIKANIWGFDLNPMAVIAARTNYLFALGDLVNVILERGGTIEIPIYLCDSVLTPTRTIGNLYGEFLEVSTSIGKFQIPAEWVRDGGFLLARAVPLIEEMVKIQYSVDEAMLRFKKEGLVFQNNEQIVENFYRQILELEKQNKNGIWARFLKNAFAPIFAGKFDFVVGNPPWVRWRFLSNEYREATLILWKNYGLFSLKGLDASLGGGEKDFSMLFVYASSDYYLKDGGKLGFLITQEVFKSKGAGEGFRRFQLGEGKYLKVLKVHDLASIQPFEGAVNKTALIILKKGEKTKYPVPYIVWSKKKGIGKIATDKLLDEVITFLQRKKLMAKPIGKLTGSWQQFSEKQKELIRIEGKNSYQARRGAATDPYGVFWLNIKHVLSDGKIIIENLAKLGKRKIQSVEEIIESDLVFPMVRGKDIERWKCTPKIYLLLTQNPNTREPYPESEMKQKWPRTYSYLIKFKDELLTRGSKAVIRLADRTSFYAMFGIGPYSMSKFKVIWKRMTTDIFSCVVSQFKTPFGYKTIVVPETVSFFPVDTESEAHYLCAIINSKPVRDFIKSFSSAGRGFGGTSVMEHVGIPKFDPKNPLHQRLAEISKQCHQLKAQGNEKEIEKLEEENDKLVIQLFEEKQSSNMTKS